ncbi:hypothetical protein SO078_29805 (plasmid) [Sinorhizobium meliloti]|uniref:hypothetical protein n=1 Tax=Rhizobium meliloti TaxID=382 RepID=UPI002D790AD6|nr:hypothetical protein [Sinorhizobium meliloti]WRQ72007.1 hypothetical protein SO078_29805 [Sinorhizobium meliloti]
MDPIPIVKPVLRLVPNGVVDGKLRMTLIATPVMAEGGFAINQWPGKIRDEILKAVSGQAEDNAIPVLLDPPPSGETKPLASFRQASLPERLQSHVNDAWASLVPTNSEELWEKLLLTIHRSLASQTFLNGLDDAPPSRSATPQPDGSYQAQEALDPNAQLKIKAVLPVKHGDLALLLEFERAKRVSELVDGRTAPRRPRTDGGYTLSDEDAGVILPTVEDKTDKDQTIGKQLDELVAAKKLAELQQAFDLLSAERANSAANVCKVLRKPDLTAVGQQDETRQAALASHTAATWEQAPSDQTNTMLERIVQCYQAIVSSPAWSRFFGFAFDMEMELSGAMPDWISTGDYPVSIKFGQVTKTVGRPWSAVDTDGWPRPDMSRGGLDKGLFLMGADCVPGDDLPRFDLVTLDVRHATEAVVRPLGTDGEGRAFQTAGMTLIDRRRAEDVRAQLRRTSTEKDQADVRLYAQDMVVGRRLDAGTKTDDGIVWRALGRKLVTYGFRREDAEGPDDFAEVDDSLADIVLNQRDATGTRTLEEAVISPSARLTPTPGGETRDKDVFVDEAFATWTGAPMGVNTAPKSGLGDLALLPFLQRHSLPSTGAKPEALVPPLRYGRSYRFGMRAVFLGGLSKSVADAATLYEKEEQAYTYPRDPSPDAQVPMRRFLRQEAIGAPAVLLPGAVLGARIDEMDFGTVQSAVLRSLPRGYVAPEDLPLKVKGRPYVPAKDRVTSDEIVRIFTPPQASLDELLRAGAFDEAAGRGDMALGGLRDIAFGVPEPLVKSKDAASGQGGFPIALIDEQRAFGHTPTRRKLAPGWSIPPVADRPAVRGAAILIGRRAFQRFGGPPLTPRPYYPDPYARMLVLRMRRRTDGAYVGPAAKVTVYDDVSKYPNAMPTVVVIKKADGDLAEAAISPATAIRTDGVTFGGKSGQRAQRVEVTLARGDDFDLEAFYLPSDDHSLATHFALTEMVGAYKLALERAGSKDPYPIAAHITTGFFDVPPDDRLLALASNIREFACGEGSHENAGGTIEELAGVFSMRVAHAVNLPLAAPAFQGSDMRVFRKAFTTSTYVHKFAIDPDFDGTPPAGNQSPDAEPRHRPSGLDPTQITLAELERLKSSDLRDVPGTHSFVLSGRIAFDRRTTSAIEVLATCVSPREVLIDDPARRRPPKARVSGAWPRRTVVADDTGNPIPPERRPARDVDVYGFEAIDMKTGAVTLHDSEVTLLRIDNIAAPGAGALASADPGASEDIIDLSLAHIAAQLGRRVTNAAGDTLFSASQLHVFPDSKARRLRLRLRAVSRFGPDFETAGRWTGADGNSQPVVRLRQPLIPAEQSLESAKPEPAARRQVPGDSKEPPANEVLVEADGSAVSLWLPSSSRPAKCAVLSPVPVFRFTRGTKGTLEDSTERISGVRIYMERGWFSAGENERLGVVMLPSSNVVPGGDAFLPDDRYGPIGAYVSRWGGDPLNHDYAPLVTGLSVGAFLSPPEPLSYVIVPVQIPKPPGARDNTTVLETADLLTYEPRFDVDREQWFVDLDIQAPETPNLFVRFGLVRYQRNTILPTLEASEPVVVWTQILPSRTLISTVTTQQAPPAAGQAEPTVMVTVTASVTGPSFKRRRIPKQPGQNGDATQDEEAGEVAKPDQFRRLNRPTMRFRLMHESGDRDDLRRVTMGIGDVPFGPVKQEERAKRSTLANNHAISICKFNFDKKDLDALGPGVVYVYAEEIESFMPATYAKEPTPVEAIFMPTTFVDSGPRFAARLDLRSIEAADGGL